MIRLEGVTVRYGSATALCELTEQIESGEWVGLIGPNGAGKTTLLRAVARLVPHEGEISIDDTPMSSLSPKHLARLVAYVPQHPELPPDMTVGHYVLLGRTPHIGYFGVESAQDRRVCSDLLDSLDLNRPPAFLTPPTLPKPKNPTGAALCSPGHPGPIPDLKS